MLNMSSKSRHPYLVSDLTERTLSFPIEYDVSCGHFFSLSFSETKITYSDIDVQTLMVQ